ncbi:MerR family transcriptional regulator [Nocardia sp. AG03]|uniref:MerR family transcriptional regulator n=1 Tax=Nocardia sp. AG03 TaxID=3025312 RepID=UPI0024182E44|nr:MerR family transcriptional regulator [Nocardia sp. AG03]
MGQYARSSTGVEVQGIVTDNTDITIGELARRTGLSVRTIRFYCDEGILESRRSAGDHLVRCWRRILAPIPEHEIDRYVSWNVPRAAARSLRRRRRRLCRIDRSHR